MAPVSERESSSSRSLSREDCVCPICLDVFTEPVTLPCSHSFCKTCFLESVDKATLCCPLCRRRAAVWVRHHSRSNTLVNETLWAQIQATFPRQKLQDDHYEPVHCPRLSEPGALRREYEDQVIKLTQEKRELEEQENKASEAYIQKLLAEEDHRQREIQLRQEEDERLARLLSQELNSVPALNQSPETSAAKKKPTGMDRFLFPLSRNPDHSTSNKENVLVASDKPPLLDYYGPHIGQSQPQDLHVGQSEPRDLHVSQSHPRDPHVSQSQPRERKESQAEDQVRLMNRPEEGGIKRKGPTEEEAESQGKRSCPSHQMGVAMSQLEAELQCRRKQEDEDLRLALELQRQLDRQQQATDRRKGSADAYPLRARGPPHGTAHEAPHPSKTTAKTAPKCRRNTSSTVTLTSMLNQATPPNKRPPSALATPPALATPTRQTTLMDLFRVKP